MKRIILKPASEIREIYSRIDGSQAMISNFECMEEFPRGPYFALEVPIEEFEHNGNFFFRNFKKMYRIDVGFYEPIFLKSGHCWPIPAEMVLDLKDKLKLILED